MAQVIFNNRIDMVATAATPSSDGYTVGYDIDGVLKQKDYLGVVTPLFSSSSQNLLQTLNRGNDSGIYSIMMGTGTSIYSSNSTGRIKLDQSNSVFIYTTASTTGTASIQISNNEVIVFNSQLNKFGSLSLSGNTYSVRVGSATNSLSVTQTKKSFLISHENTEAYEETYAEILNVGSNYAEDNGYNTPYVHINSPGSTTMPGIKGSVIIGGMANATEDYMVYLGTRVRINDAYTLPSNDGNANQYLITDGNGLVSWGDASLSTPPLDQVLAVGNSSESYNIVMGSGTSIKSNNGYGSIQLDSGYNSGKILISADGSNKDKSYIELDNSNLVIGATSGTITTGDLKGLQYSADYTSTFVNNSLITKQYVDSKIGNPFTTYKIAYVDPDKGSDTTGLVDRVDKPFATVAKAISGLTSSYSFSLADPGLVYLKKGLYTNTVYLKNYIDFYCEPDVIFSQNGFTDINEVVNSSIYGYAKFIGTNTNLVPLDVTNASNIEFNFSVIDNQTAVLKVTNTTGKSTVKINGNSIKCNSGFSKAILIGSNSGNTDVYSDVSINVSGKIIGAYNTILVSNKFVGNLEVNASSIECNSNLNTNGPAVGLQNALLVRGASASVRINADLVQSSSSNAGGVNAAVSISSGTVSIVGNISGGECPGVYLFGFSGDSPNYDPSSVSIFGNISSKKEAIINDSTKAKLKVNNSFIKTEGLGTNPYAINISAASMSTTYLYNTQIFNSLQDSGLILISATESKLGIYNSLGHSPGTSGKFIYCASTASVGIHNTRSNKDNSDDVEDLFTPSGFIYDQNLYLGDF